MPLPSAPFAFATRGRGAYCGSQGKCNPTRREGAMVDRDHEANLIRQKIDDWVASAGRHDAEAVARFYTSDGKFLFPNAPIAEGHAAVAAMWNNLFGLPNVRLKF